MDALTKIMNEAAALRGGLSNAISGAQGEMQAASQEQKAAIADRTSGQTASLQETQRVESARQQQKQDIAVQLGVTPADKTRAALSAQILSSRQDLERAQADLASVTQSRFSDNPLGWLVDQFRMPFVQDEVSAAQARFNSAATAYNTLDTSAQNAFQTVDALNKEDSTTKFKSAMAILNAQARMDSAQIDRENARDGLASAKALADVGLAQNAQEFQVLQYKQQQANHEESMAMQRAHYAEARADKAKKEQYMSLLRLGMASLETDPVKRENILQMNPIALERAFSSNPQLEQIAYEAGFHAAKNNGVPPADLKYGASPSQALNLMESAGLGTERFRWLANIKNEIVSSKSPSDLKAAGVENGNIMYQKAMGADGKQTVIAPGFDTAVLKKLNDKAANIHPEDKSNPFIAPSLVELTAADPKISSFGIVSDLAKFGPAGADISNPIEVLNKLYQVNPNRSFNATVTEVSKLYERSRAYTNAKQGFTAVGIDPKILTAGYTVSGIDFTQPGEVARSLGRTLAGNKRTPILPWDSQASSFAIPDALTNAFPQGSNTTSQAASNFFNALIPSEATRTLGDVTQAVHAYGQKQRGTK